MEFSSISGRFLQDYDWTCGLFNRVIKDYRIRCRFWIFAILSHDCIISTFYRLRWHQIAMLWCWSNRPPAIPADRTGFGTAKYMWLILEKTCTKKLCQNSLTLFVLQMSFHLKNRIGSFNAKKILFAKNFFTPS